MFTSLQNKVFEYVYLKVLDNIIVNDFIPNRYKFFQDNNIINQWGKGDSEYFNKIYKAMGHLNASETEIKELEMFDFYAGKIGRLMNDVLRGEIIYSNKEYIEDCICELESYLKKFSVMENVVSIRRMPCEYIDKRYKPNNTFIEKGFLSTSLNLNSRLDYESNNKPLNNEAILIIKVPKGICGAYIEHVQPEHKLRNESELLLQRNSHIYVEKSIKVLTNRIIVLQIISNK